jgi:hypothetical protein
MDKLFMVTVKVAIIDHEQQFKIRCKPSMTMKEVYDKIASKINLNDFILKVNDKNIDDSVTLLQCDVVNLKNIDVIEKPIESKNITILVSKLAEKPISITNIFPDMSINDFTKHIETIINIPSDKQKLVFNQIILNKSKSLSQYNVINESKIFVTILK